IPFPPAERLHLVAMDFLAAGDGYRVGYAAAFRHDTPAALAALDVPIIAAAREDDLLFGHLERMPKLPVGSQIVRLSADRDAWGRALRDIFLAYARDEAAPPLATRLLEHRPSKLFVRAGGRDALVRAMPGNSGQPLVLLHHAPGGSSDFIDTMQRYRGARPVYALDLPGQGDSDPLGSGATMADYAEAVSRTL